MEIYISSVWNHPEAIKIILSNIPTLDPLAVVFNADLFYIKGGSGIAAFATRKRFGNSRELGTVYTCPEYRKHGYAKALIRAIVNSRHTTYVLCEESLAPFYEKCGFKRCTRCNLVTRVRRKLFNIFLGPICGYSLVSLETQKKPKESYSL